jgi:hypothetical protein
VDRKVLAAVCLSAAIAAAYLAVASTNTAMITKLRTGSTFTIVYVVGAVLSGFIGYSFASLFELRLLKRLVMVGCMALGLYACGNISRGLLISRLFQQDLTGGEEALPVTQLRGKTLGLRSPYTGTVFYLPTTIVASPGLAQFALAGKCAKVKVEENAAGDKRIAADNRPLSIYDVVHCPGKSRAR